MRAIVLLFAAPIALAGCAAATPAPDEPVRIAPSGECDAAAVQDMIGMTATAELGASLVAASGTEILRWAPPRSAVTMDFRPDRLTVSYDDDMKIDRIGCG